jgi:hypothetical protein
MVNLAIALLRLASFMQRTFSRFFLSAHDTWLISDELLEDIIMLLDDDIIMEDDIEDMDEEDITDDELEDMLSARLNGMRATAADAAIKKERDFFIRKMGEETGLAYHKSSLIELAYYLKISCFYKCLSRSVCFQYGE